VPILVESCFKEAPFEEICGDIVMGSVAPSIGLTDPIYTELLDSTSISSPLLLTSPSHLHAFHEFLGGIRGYYPSFDPYCEYLEDVPRK